jgi:hypothetical protein
MGWNDLSASLFCVARNRPYEVLAISMGAFFSATSPALLASVVVVLLPPSVCELLIWHPSVHHIPHFQHRNTLPTE